jgi:hypothetical protein
LTIAVILGHLLLDILFGWSLLSFLRGERAKAETLVVSALIGMYFETLLAATLLFLGVHVAAAGLAVAGVMAVPIATGFYRGHLGWTTPIIEKPRWYEWLLLISVGEKLLFAAWQLVSTRTYFDDALTHWSGRARALFGEVNWSFDASSPLFLGRQVGNYNYPLLTIVWRTLSAKASGEWNDIIARADGLVFFVVIVATVWLAAWRISRVRWLAAAVAFAISSLPLHRWHEASGYSDIAVEAFVAAAVAALLRKDWLLAGILAAGAVWSKNDGLLLYVPALVAGVALMQWRKVPVFLAGFITVAPWLIFNSVHHLGFSPFRTEIAWHSDAVMLFINILINNPTSSILWISILACLIYSSAAMFKDTVGRALLFAFLFSLGSIAFVFTSTSAYAFLSEQTTIHRTLMQFSGMAILVAVYGLCIKIRQSLKADAAAKA